MTVRVERTFEFPVAPERVWAFIADPELRARPISVVDRFDGVPTAVCLTPGKNG